MVLVGKNIRERLQKYDTKLTNASALKNFFILAKLEFQQIVVVLFQILSYNTREYHTATYLYCQVS